MIVKMTSCCAIVLLVAWPAWAQMPSVSDADFAMKASVGNTFEVEEAKLAKTMATDARLKQFADMMIADHSDAEKTLQAAAGKAGQKSEMMLDRPHQAMVDNLKSLSGTDFDKIYIADQVAGHVETQSLLSDYKQNGQNGDLKSWADKTLPTVKHHLDMINAM